MQFLSLEPFVPSGKDFQNSKLFFQELGFTANWDTGGYAGLEKDGCKFILQHYDNNAFAENFMVSIKVSNATAFYDLVIEKKLPEKYAIRVTPPKKQPYGLEVNIIDIAGVCWHFVE
jgi:hypothetical protein